MNMWILTYMPIAVALGYERNDIKRYEIYVSICIGQRYKQQMRK